MKVENGFSTRHLAMVCVSGTLLATSCTPAQMNAILNGVTVLASALNEPDNDISFFDWLESELDD